MFSHPWLQDKNWDHKDPQLAELDLCAFRIPHLEEVLEKIPLEEGVFGLLGPRQVGKSTLLRLLARKVLRKLPPQALVLLEGDLVESWKELLSLLSDFLSKIRSSDHNLKACILIDEISSIPQWARALKVLADRKDLKKILLIYTGSSSASLKEGGELLPGRRGKHAQSNFELYPASYHQVSAHLSLEEYFQVGGFPWAINEYLRLKSVPPYVGEIYWSWLKGEFLKKGKSDVLLRHLIKHLVERVGTPISLNKIAQEIGIASHETARQYLELLKDCFALHELYWIDFHRHILAPRKNRKYFPIDPLLFHLFKGSGLLGEISSNSEQDGRLAELVVCQQLKKILAARNIDLGYWMGKKEIDFSPIPIEVKYQNRVHAGEFVWFEKSYPKKKLLVLTKNDHFSQGAIRGLPLREWLLSPELPE